MQDLPGSNELSLVNLRAGGDELAILEHAFAFLQQARPAIWADVMISRPEDVAGWKRLLKRAEGAWSYVAAFDRQGQPLLAGELASERQGLSELLTFSAAPAARLALIPHRFLEPCAEWLPQA